MLPWYRTLAGGSPPIGERWTLRESGPARAGTEGLTVLTLLLALCCSRGPSETLGTLLGDYHCGDTLAIVYLCNHRDCRHAN